MDDEYNNVILNVEQLDRYARIFIFIDENLNQDIAIKCSSDDHTKRNWTDPSKLYNHNWERFKTFENQSYVAFRYYSQYSNMFTFVQNLWYWGCKETGEDISTNFNSKSFRFAAEFFVYYAFQLVPCLRDKHALKYWLEMDLERKKELHQKFLQEEVPILRKNRLI